MIHNTDTVAVSSWYMEEAYKRVKKPDEFHRYKPNNAFRQMIMDGILPSDLYILIWEGNIDDWNCTKDLAYLKIPKVMWFSDSYPIPGYMDYFSFEVMWARATRPDIILMAQRGKIEEMQKLTGIRTFWMPFA